MMKESQFPKSKAQFAADVRMMQDCFIAGNGVTQVRKGHSGIPKKTKTKE